MDVGWCWIPGRIWSGAWVSFAVGPSYIGWCPLNFYNRPVFHDVTIVNVVNVNVNRLEPRGWRFVSVDRFADPGSRRAVLRSDRLPRGTEVVITSKLPRFDPKEVAQRPERGARLVETVRANRAPLPVVRDRDNRPIPFRNQERASESRSRRAPPAGPDPGRSRTQRGGPAGRTGPAVDTARSIPQGPMSRPRPRPDNSPVIVGGPQDRTRSSPSGQDRGRRGVFEPSRGPARPPTGATQTPRGTDRGPQPRSLDTPRREPPQPETRRSAPRSDQMIGRLFDGVRGDRTRGRVEPPRGQSPRPPAAAPQSSRRPEPRPPTPRPQPPKEHGNEGHRH